MTQNTIEDSIIATNQAGAKWRFTGFLLFIALVIEVYFLFYDVPFLNLWFSKSAKSHPRTATPIAELVARQNIVRIQAPGDLVWEETRNGLPLNRRDSVLTLDRSQAEIAFLDGTGLVVDENSLVLIEKNPASSMTGGTAGGPLPKIVIKLLRGSLHKRRPRGKSEENQFEIETRDGRLTLSRDTELSVTAHPELTQGTRVVVQHGAVKTSQNLVVKEGEEAQLDHSDSPPTARKMTFALLTPRTGDNIKSENGPIQFSWNVDGSLAGDHPIELEVSPDPEFKTDVVKKRIPATQPPMKYFEVLLTLPPMFHSKPQLVPWYWRVVSLKPADMLSSSVERFWISSQPRPTQLSLPPPPTKLFEPQIRPQQKKPAPTHSWINFFINSLIRSAWADEDPHWRIHLEWEAVDGIKKYRVQIGRESTFKHIISEADTDVPNWDWNYKLGMENSKGRVFYRVASISEDGKTGEFSTPRPIQIPENILASARLAPSAAQTTPTEIQQTTILDTPVSTNLAFGLSTGIGNRSQSNSDSNLNSVTNQSAYLQQKVFVSVRRNQWELQFQATGAQFHKANEERTQQPDVRAFSFKTNLLYWKWEKNAAIGMTLDRPYRWVKSGPQSVDPAGTLSLGPMAVFVRNYSGIGHGVGMIPMETGASLSAPVTGILTGGHLGLEGLIWGEWKLTNHIGLRLEAEGGYLTWTSSSSHAWTFWVAPVFRL